MSAIDDKCAELVAAGTSPGDPTSDEQACSDGTGRFRTFTSGAIYWHPSTGAWWVHGAIYAHYQELGLERSVLGYPTTDETGCADGVGRYNDFQTGSMYWTQNIGAREVHGAIGALWQSLGRERGPNGYPTTDETRCADGTGRFNDFQNGSVYWTPATGAHEVHGAIAVLWASLGRERSPLGYPTTNEADTPDAQGRFNHFQVDSIYWYPGVGAFVTKRCLRVHFKILQAPAIGTDTELLTMRRVYAQANVAVHLGSVETLNLPALLDVDGGQCLMGPLGPTTGDQTALFANRNGAAAGDLVVYFVRSLLGGLFGCSHHPAGSPGATVASTATQWTTAHELGHVLGLQHDNGDTTLLMYGGGTNNISVPLAQLRASDVTTMQGNAALTFSCK